MVPDFNYSSKNLPRAW